MVPEGTISHPHSRSTGLVPFLSDAWFREARDVTRSLPRLRGLHGRLQFDAASGDQHRRWVQVIEDGRVTQWDVGELPDPDVEVRWRSYEDARGVFFGDINGSDALRLVTVVARHPEGLYEGPAPPLDQYERPELAEAPRIPEATFIAQFDATNTPVGPVSIWASFVDGRVADSGFGPAARPDVVVAGPYRDALRVRAGEITLSEGLRSTKITGGEPVVVMLAGIYESSAYQRAMRACGNVGRALGDLGEVVATDAYQRAMAALANITERS
jgi:hypothetical protein